MYYTPPGIKLDLPFAISFFEVILFLPLRPRCKGTVDAVLALQLA